jgi:hypothetical protein
VLDSNRLPKGGYEALRQSSQPLQVALEHDGRRPYAIWVFNDTPLPYPNHVVGWKAFDPNGCLLLEGEIGFDVAANSTQRVIGTKWPISPAACARIDLELRDANGKTVSSNSYRCSSRCAARAIRSSTRCWASRFSSGLVRPVPTRTPILFDVFHWRCVSGVEWLCASSFRRG